MPNTRRDFFITSTAVPPCVVRSLSTLYTLRSTCMTILLRSPVTSASFNTSTPASSIKFPRSCSIFSRVMVTSWVSVL